MNFSRAGGGVVPGWSIDALVATGIAAVVDVVLCAALALLGRGRDQADRAAAAGGTEKINRLRGVR